MSKATPKLLLIENLSACSRLLPSEAFELASVANLAAALEKINGHAHDLILLDLALPDGNGLSAFSQVHAAAPQTVRRVPSVPTVSEQVIDL